MWQLCFTNGWWSVLGRPRRGKAEKPGPPAHDDKVRRDFTAAQRNRLWLTDITEHPTHEGKLYLCAVKDVFSGRIVGYSISDRMKGRLASQPSPAPSPATAQTPPAAPCTATGAAKADSTGRRNSS